MAVKTREKLIEVARQLFARKGVAKTTINDIAEASAKGRRTVYTYFRNKKEIYDAVIEAESDRMVQGLRKIAEGAESVPLRMSRFLLYRLTNDILHDSAKSWWTRLDIRRTMRIKRLIRDKVGAMLSRLIHEGIADGSLLPDRCRQLEKFIYVCLDSFDSESIDTHTDKDAPYALVRFIMTDICADGTVFAFPEA